MVLEPLVYLMPKADPRQTAKARQPSFLFSVDAAESFLRINSVRRAKVRFSKEMEFELKAAGDVTTNLPFCMELRSSLASSSTRKSRGRLLPFISGLYEASGL